MARTSTKKAPEATTTENNSPANEKKVYLLTDVGMNAKGPFAFHVEGFLTRDPSLTTGKEDKEPMLSTSIGIGMGVKAMMAKAKGEEAPEGEDSTFVNIVIKGKMAESFAEKAKKGTKVAVTGGISQKVREYKGTPREEITIWVNDYVILPKEGGTRKKRISSTVRIYTDRDGNAQSENIVTLLTGKVVNLQPLATSPGGKNYLKCGLALAVPAKKVFDLATAGKVGTYPEDANTFINVTFFGNAADAKAKFLKSGMVIAVTGRIKEDEYEGKISYSMFPNDVSIVAWPPKDAEAADDGETQGSDSYEGGYASAPDVDQFAELTDEDDDNELPF